MQIKYRAFPDYLAPDSEKGTNEYGLKMAKAIEYEWFHRPENSCSTYYSKREEYHKLRLYARGEQPVDIYKKLIAKGKKNSYTNYDWRPLQIIPKFVKLITNQMAERLYEVKVEATDKFSTDLKDNHKKYLERVVAARPIYELAQETFGVDIAPPDVAELPQTNEEVEVFMQMKYKPLIEIVSEEALRFTLDYNDYNETQTRIIEDITTIGIGAVKHMTDPTKGILVKYVDPACMVYSYPSERNFKNVHYYGEVERITINELERVSGTTFTKDQLRDFGLTSKEWANYHGNNNTIGYNRDSDMKGLMVDVLHFTYKTTNTVTYKKKQTKTGGFNMTKKDSTFNLKKDGEDNGYEVVKKVIDVWYEGSLVLGTDHIYNYRLCENMIRPKGFLNQTAPNYVVYAPELYQNRTRSLVGRIIPYVDQMQQIHIKLQQLIAKARPNGIYIDVEGLNEIDLGGGNFLTPLEAIRIYDETGNMLGSSISAEGEYNYGKEPIKELKNGIVDGLDRLMSAYNHYLNLLRDAIGIPQGADASMPHPDTLVGVQQQVALNSNTATRHILDGSLSITKNLVSGLSLRLKDIFKYSDLKEVYTNAVGRLGVEALKTMENFALYDLGINIEIKPDAEEKGYLESNIQAALSKGLINIADASDIRSINNTKLANRVIETRIKRREQEEAQRAQDQIKATAEAQMQSNQVAAENKLREIQATAEAKIAAINAEKEAKKETLMLEAELKSGLMDKEFQFNMQLRGSEAMIKQQAEDKNNAEKLRRQNIKDTNTSKMNEQKKFGLPAMNFESSEDNLSGGMELSEMNPD